MEMRRSLRVSLKPAQSDRELKSLMTKASICTRFMFANWLDRVDARYSHTKALLVAT